MHIISWNVNGLRAVQRKNELAPFLASQQPDVLFLQEIKAKPHQLTEFSALYPDYHQVYHSAEKPGYAGTAVWWRKGVAGVTHTGMPGWNDTEGRVIRLDVDEWSFLGVYFPNGGKSEDAWHEKLRFYAHFLGYVDNLHAQGRRVAWGGDINCAHAPIDLARPKDNDGKIGFHPRERAWIDDCLAHGWQDVFRTRYPEAIVYSWWHLISRARSRNVGWRIDAWFAHQQHTAQVDNVTYLTQQMGSDHCPVALSLLA